MTRRIGKSLYAGEGIAPSVPPAPGRRQMSDSGMTDAKGHWRKLVPAEHKPVIHRCQAPSDPQVQAISAEGSEWVCDECGRVWEARKVNFLGYGVSLYPTKNYERGGDGETDDEERN